MRKTNGRALPFRTVVMVAWLAILLTVITVLSPGHRQNGGPSWEYGHIATCVKCL